MRVLSLFDGMACGMIAMQFAGVEVESYDAYEIDKYAVKTAQHNFPMIQEHGDVFNADFTQYAGVDFLIGGSPCTHWSIAQTQNRETTVSRDEKGQILLHSSGIGFELFSQYLRALDEAKPKYFIYENNKSMSKEIRAAITECFGFEPVCINSALVSAQNRQRLYWVGIRNADGTYSKVNVEQPEDRGILLKDVLDGAVAMREKSHAVIASAARTTEREYFIKNQGNMAAEPVNVTADGKSQTLKAQYIKNNVENFCCYESTYGATGVAEPIQVGAVGNMYGKGQNGQLFSLESKTKTLSSGQGNAGRGIGLSNAPKVIIPAMLVREATAKGYTEIECGDCVDLSMPNSKTRRGRNMADKSNCMQTSNEFYQYVGYAIEFDEDGKPTKAIGKDGKEITIYEVRDGKITIKGKQYPIKLKDGYYIIRKLTVSECKRLQTVPEWYDFSCVSNSQAYKMLGNGWTCEVIAHLIKSALTDFPCEYPTTETERGLQFSLF